MVLDSSAIIAIVLGEARAQHLIETVSKAEIAAVAAPMVLESSMVLWRKLNKNPLPQLLELLRSMDVEIVLFDDLHCQVAVKAFERFGKGRHRAALNFGDCMSVATAQVAGRPLLYVGDDFTKAGLSPL